MQEQPNIVQFFNELATNQGLQNQWRENRGDVLRRRGFSGEVLGALVAGDIARIQDIARQQQGGEVIVLAYIK